MNNNNLLNVNVANVRRQAERLEQLSSQLTKTLARVNDLVMNCRMAWEGDAAASFDQFMTSGHDNLEKFGSQMKNSAKSLKQIASAAKKAQDEAKRLTMQ